MIKLTTNLFSYINYDFSEIGVTNAALDFYFISKYSNRWCSPVLDLLIEDDEISTQNLTVLGSYINQLYKNKWDRLSALLLTEYDPIHNFLDQIEESITDTDDKTVVLDSDKTSGNTRTDNTTRTDDLTRTDNLTREDDLEQTTSTSVSKAGENSLYGFNSDDAVPSDENSNTHSLSETVTNEGTVENTGTVKNTGTVRNTGTVTDAGTATVDNTETTDRDYTRERTVTHTGNIGNIATQDLLQKEVDFWQWNFIIQVLSDVADVITLPSY